MPRDIDRLAPQRPVKVPPGKAHRKTSEQHVADRHFVDHGIEPLDEQELNVGRLTPYVDLAPRFDFGVGDLNAQAPCSNASAAVAPRPRTSTSASCAKCSHLGLQLACDAEPVMILPLAP